MTAVLDEIVTCFLGELDDEEHHAMAKLYLQVVNVTDMSIDFDSVWPVFLYKNRDAAIRALWKTCGDENSGRFYAITRAADGSLKPMLNARGIMELGCLGRTRGSRVFVKVMAKYMDATVSGRLPTM